MFRQGAVSREGPPPGRCGCPRLDASNAVFYGLTMTKLLDEALEAVRPLPADAQDEIARALQLAANEGEPEPIEAEHLSAVLEGLAQAARREFASDQEVEAAFRRFDP